MPIRERNISPTMTVPEVRVRLNQLAVSLACPELALLAFQLHRRPYVRKAPAQRRGVPHDEIRAYAAAHTDLDYMGIASALGVNTGRVSEALAGFR